MPYLNDWSEGNRNSTLYNNLCLAYKEDDYEKAAAFLEKGRESGMTRAEVRSTNSSAKKSNIAHSNNHITPLKWSKKLTTTKPKENIQDLTAQFKALPDARLDHPYLMKKRIEPIGCIKQQGNLIYIPFYNLENPQIIQSWQTIDGQGNKLFKKGHQIQGSYFCYSKLQDRIYVFEGYATAISGYMLTGHQVVACGSRGRFKEVLEHLKKKHPKIQIIACLDNDGPKTKDPDIPKNIKVIKPLLPFDKEKYDYNDYMIDDLESATIELFNLNQVKTLKTLDKEKNVQWLTEGYIAKRALTLLIGDKGAGKTTYCVSVAVEKIIETGKRIIYFSNENDPEVVIMNIVKEKAKSLFPNLSKEDFDKKFEYVRGKFQIIETSDNPMSSVQHIKEALKVLHIGQYYCMVIIDPIADVIKKLTDNEEARPIMTNFRIISEMTSVPILLTLNRKKNIHETELIDQGMGAGTIVNVPKIVLYLKKIKGQDKISILFKVANNYGNTDGATLFSYKTGKDKEGKDSIGCLETEDVLTESRDDLVKKYIKSTEGRDEIKDDEKETKERLETIFKQNSKLTLDEIKNQCRLLKDRESSWVSRRLKKLGYESKREGSPLKFYWSKKPPT